MKYGGLVIPEKVYFERVFINIAKQCVSDPNRSSKRLKRLVCLPGKLHLINCGKWTLPELLSELTV